MPALKGSQASIMVWGCFSDNKLGPLLTFNKGGINSADYITTLKNGLLPFIERLNGLQQPLDNSIAVATMGKYIFQQDNACPFIPQLKPIASFVPTASSS
jgi:hypothetical protein